MHNLYVDSRYILIKSLGAMIRLLKKVEGQAKERGMEEKDLLEARLAPDMFPFVKQVQVMSDNAKAGMGRLSGKEIPSMEDNEASLQQLVERLEKTLAFVESVSEEDLRDADAQKIVIKYMPDKYQTAEDYTRDYLLSNFYFHFATAYAILRMKGYDIGKADFVGGLNLRDL